MSSGRERFYHVLMEDQAIQAWVASYNKGEILVRIFLAPVSHIPLAPDSPYILVMNS